MSDDATAAECTMACVMGHTNEPGCLYDTTPKNAGYSDEPQHSAAIVAVHYGEYERQEIWVRSGANIGNWYYLGGEYGRPYRGEIPAHPTWADVMARGPVTLLVAGAQAAYAAGWRNGRRRLREQVEAMEDEEPTDEG